MLKGPGRGTAESTAVLQGLIGADKDQREEERRPGTAELLKLSLKCYSQSTASGLEYVHVQTIEMR